MDSQQQLILRMELQIGQLIRLVANLNERIDVLEKTEREREMCRVMHINSISRI